MVMDHTPHCLITGPALDTLAEHHGLETCDPSYFITPHRTRQLEQARAVDVVQLDHGSHEESKPSPQKMGTVGAVACDIFGNLAGLRGHAGF